MNIHTEPYQVKLEPNDSHQLANLCGPFDAHLRQIEKRLGITINNRGNNFQLLGESRIVRSAGELLIQLYQEVKNGTHLSAEVIHLYLQDSGVDGLLSDEADGNDFLITTRKKTIKPRGKNQIGYVQAVRAHDINFGIGPAGTGKTYLAVACAVEALDQELVRRILLVRPAVEAGEKLGFLPGDLSQKIDPYLRPLYDALYEMIGFERVEKLIEKNIIEVAPLAYMRGRTLNESFIILDESQNTTTEQMKMFLTRVGFGSTVVVTGDVTQVDLPSRTTSGLRHVLNVLTDIEGISFTHFSSRDVVRHPLVQRIVEAYEKFEAGGGKS
ncbi:MAG: PhoH family protein [Pseudomonadales bacterium]|nr:PhoH family protein [Pseudomonadales bacterium]MDP4639991.1 PhoH family protein [Pseudomonadales bacterium]MDP4765341.1 PhoH family protein [Pseudomonadales bacterium]MDP4874543.1 PhoH family protein [Pseudomonadales bacterium]MDP4910518.1 PhoH family protein [Pseudomonadales bacterium]